MLFWPNWPCYLIWGREESHVRLRSPESQRRSPWPVGGMVRCVCWKQTDSLSTVWLKPLSKLFGAMLSWAVAFASCLGSMAQWVVLEHLWVLVQSVVCSHSLTLTPWLCSFFFPTGCRRSADWLLARELWDCPSSHQWSLSERPAKNPEWRNCTV